MHRQSWCSATSWPLSTSMLPGAVLSCRSVVLLPHLRLLSLLHLSLLSQLPHASIKQAQKSSSSSSPEALASTALCLQKAGPDQNRVCWPCCRDRQKKMSGLACCLRMCSKIRKTPLHGTSVYTCQLSWSNISRDSKDRQSRSPSGHKFLLGCTLFCTTAENLY